MVYLSKNKNTLQQKINKIHPSKRLGGAYPELNKYALRTVRFPDISPSDLSPTTYEKVVWKCQRCSKEYQATVVLRTETNSSFCDECTKYKRIHTRLLNTPEAQKLRNSHPDLWKCILRSQSIKDYPLEYVSFGSRHTFYWQCNCGKEFISDVKSRVKAKHAVCPSCRRTGQSLFEFEIKYLLEASLSLEIKQQHKKQGTPKIDLYVPKYDIAIQLDPYWSHKDNFERDVRINKSHERIYAKVLRFRQKPLDTVGNTTFISSKNTATLDEWVDKILMTLNLPKLVLNEAQREQALKEANDAWNLAFTIKDKNITQLSFYNEYVKNLDHPGRSPLSMSLKSGDICLWRCEKGHEWEASPHRRQQYENTLCPDCNTYKKSIGFKAPSLAAEFIKCLTNEEKSIDNLGTGSLDLCIWKCICGHPVKSTPNGRWPSVKSVTYNNGSKHGHKKISLNEYLSEEDIKKHFSEYVEKQTLIEEEKLRKKNKSLNSVLLHPAYRYYIKNKTNPSRSVEKLGIRSQDICLWKCENGHSIEDSPRHFIIGDTVRLCSVCHNVS